MPHICTCRTYLYIIILYNYKHTDGKKIRRDCVRLRGCMPHDDDDTVNSAETLSSSDYSTG